MTEIAKPIVYAIVGTGAVGGYYGGRLAHAGKTVHFLVRSEYEVIARDGLKVRSCDGDFAVRVNAWRDPAAMPRPDVAIICLKALDTPRLAPILKDLLAPHSLVATLQNGLGNEEAIALDIGADRVIAGSAFICAEREAPGVIGHYAAGALGFARFGAASLGVDRMIERMRDDFVEAGVKARIEETAATLKWGKLVWNVPFSGLAVFHRGDTTDRILADPLKRAFAEELMKEIIRAARACGATIPDGAVERNFTATEKMGAYKPSMLVDFLKGRPMEIDAIVGEPLRRGRAAGLRLPALERLHAGLLRIDSECGAR